MMLYQGSKSFEQIFKHVLPLSFERTEWPWIHVRFNGTKEEVWFSGSEDALSGIRSVVEPNEGKWREGNPPDRGSFKTIWYQGRSGLQYVLTKVLGDPRWSDLLVSAHLGCADGEISFSGNTQDLQDVVSLFPGARWSETSTSKMTSAHAAIYGN